MGIQLNNTPKINLNSDCPICLYPLVEKNWQGRNVVGLHTSSEHPCYFHESCIRTWAGSHGESSNRCPPCTKPISNVTFYECTKDGIYKEITRPPLKVYQPPEGQEEVEELDEDTADPEEMSCTSPVAILILTVLAISVAVKIGSIYYASKN